MPLKRRTKKLKSKLHKKVRIPKVIRFKPTHQQPVPNMLSDAFEMCWQGQLLVRAGSANQVLSVHANNLITGSAQGPFRCGAAGTNWNNTTNFRAVPTLSATFLNYPTGFTSFISTGTAISSLYQRYFVTGVSYAYTVQPTVGADTIKFAVFPDTPGNVATLSTNYTDITEAENAPWAKSKIAYGANTSAGNTIRGYLNIPKYLGMTKKDMLKDHGYSGLSNFTTLSTTELDKLVTLNSQFTTMSSADLTAVVNVAVKLKYYVTFQLSQGKNLTD